MGFDEEYLEDLLKSIEPIIYPEGRPDADDVPEMPEEELDSRIAEPQDSVVYEEEVIEDDIVPVQDTVPTEEPVTAEEPDNGMVNIGGIELDPADGNKQLSADEIAALFAAADASSGQSAADNTPEQESSADEATEKVEDAPVKLEYDPADGNKVLSADEIGALFAAAGGNDTASQAEEEADSAEAMENDLDVMSLLGEAGEPAQVEEEIDLEGMSEEEIDAMLSAAKSSSEESLEVVSEDDDLLAMLAAAGDENLDDIQNLLDSDANGEAVDEAAFLSATAVGNEADTVLETKEEAKARKKREKAEKKAKKKKGNADEGLEDEIIIEGPKKGLFSRIIAALTESDDDEPEHEEISIDIESGEATIDISDENRDILAELDGEKGKKKPKKAKKAKKAKKGKKGDNPDEEADLDGDGAESKAKKKKEKKPKKPKKSKEAKEQEPSRPEKKLPKKRVRRVMFLGASIAAAILVAVFGLTRLNLMQEARWAFDNQDYQTVYDDLYGMKLSGSDAEIFNKSQTIMSLERKLVSYQNYSALGMREDALVALLNAVANYPSVRENAVKYGVEGNVDYTYSQIVDALGTFGLSEADAKEIVAYDSKVKYTKRIKSIVNGTPFDYGDEMNQVTPEQEDVKPSIDDILPEESDFLPDNPDDVFEVDYSGASELTPEEIEAMNDLEAEVQGQNGNDGREIEAEVEIIDSRN